MPPRKTTLFATAPLVSLAVALAAAALIAVSPWTAEPTIWRAAGVVVLGLGLWAAGFLPLHITSLIVFLVALVLNVAPPDVVLSGFHAGATWLVFGGLVVTLAAQRSGLAERAVRVLLARVPPGYAGVAAGLALAGFALAFVVPAASGRAMLVAPLALAVADRLGFARTDKAAHGLVLAAGMGTTLPAFGILPANVVNMVFLGAVESIHHIGFSYFEYTALNLPVLGLGGLVVQVAVVVLLFGRRLPGAVEKPATTAWSGEERRVLLILAATLLLWSTDFLHGVSPAWVALAAALACVIPGVGPLKPGVFSGEVNYATWLFVAAVIGVGAMANHTGLGSAVGAWVIGHVPLTRDGGVVTFLELVGIGTVVSLVTTFPTVPPILTAAADALAAATGWPLRAVLLAQVPTWILPPLPYLAPPLMIAIAAGGVPMGRAVRALGLYFVIAAPLLLPLQYFWGRLLGAYP
ncbi:MAG: SLC13 family permease [Alphaproteobacteria bacterium]